MKPLPYIVILLLVSFAAAGLYISAKKPQGSTISSGEFTFSEQKAANTNMAASVPTVEKAPDLPQRYDNKEFRLSFSYPKGYTVSLVPGTETDGATIIVQDAEAGVGFQIVVTPWDEPDTSITKARIKKDIPDMKVSDEQEVLIGESGKGLAFVSDNPAFGTSREVWFIFKGNLYQLSTYLAQDKLLQAVLGTWKFY